ncbi:RNA-binding protein CP33, chloroplastic isoform X2 [Malania oleifera]|uniref:RNA-binding protein CP33, chloroplastic isoform X2 n=1 Tax=Malania oleifera TaxID=397392 RepID=UPI0025AE4557|nr:RNA-binding protein CP33, chloroplastic isoform X2 [Malania oleifera]
MALLRLLYFPSATSVSAKQQSTATLSSKKPPQSTDLKASFLSCSTFSMSSFSVSHTCAIETRRRTGLFVLRISSSTRSPVPSSSSSASSAVTVENHEALNPVVESEPEEISRTRLCAANIPWTSTPEDIRALFEKHGTVLDVELSMYNKTRNRGLAFITMGSADEALAALINLESYDVDGRALKVNYAKPQKKKPPPSVPPKPISRHDLFVANLPYEARGFYGETN